MVAARVQDGAGDLENLEGVEAQAGMVALGIGQAGDGVEQGLVEVGARAARAGQVMVLVMLGHD